MQNFKSASLINTMQVYAVEVMYCVASLKLCSISGSPGCHNVSRTGEQKKKHVFTDISLPFACLSCEVLDIYASYLENIFK